MNLIKFFQFKRFFKHLDKNTDGFSQSKYLIEEDINRNFLESENKKLNFYLDKISLLESNNRWLQTNLNQFLNILEPFKNNKMNILELGSYQGVSAFFFLDYLENSKIKCVDCFDIHPNNLDIFKKNLKKYFNTERLEVYNETTLSFFSKGLKENFYDLIYVDAGHGYLDVITDLYYSYLQLKLNGLMLLDDYLWYEGKVVDLNKGVRLAINDFLERANGTYEVIYFGYSVAIKKIKNFEATQFRNNFKE